MPLSFRTLAACAAVLAISAPVRGAIVTTASGVYDEQTLSLNTVDQSATSPITGTVNLVSLATFQTNVANAFATNTGGVINFDDVTGSQTGNISVTYGGGTLQITSPNGFVDMSALGTINATPISGGTYLRSSAVTHTLTFTQGLSELGFTVLARNGTRNVTATVNYSGGGSGAIGPFAITSIGTTPAAPNAATANDTFFGFTAPAGATITGLTVTDNAGGFIVIDDIGFVVAVPEPSSVLLLAMGAAGLAWAGRQRLSKGAKAAVT